MRIARSELSRNLFLALIACGLVTAVGEVVARSTMPAPLPWLLPQSLYEPSDTVGFRYRRSQVAFTADKPFRTNSMGLRGRESTWEKPPSTSRVLLLGDSIAQGFGVREEDTFASVLERLLNRGTRGAEHEVINAGVGGYNTTQEVAYLMSEGMKLSPDVVVLALYWNDISDKSGIDVSAEGFLLERGSTSGPVDRAWTAAPSYMARNVLKRSRLFYFIVDRVRQLRIAVQPDVTRANQLSVLAGTDNRQIEMRWREIEGQLALLKSVCEQQAALLVAILPMPQQLTGEFPDVRYQTVVQDICGRLGLHCLDLLPAFERAFAGHTSLFLPYDGDHPNEDGHRLIAQELSPVVIDMVSRRPEAVRSVRE